MCLHKPTFFLILPPSWKEGGQGDGRTDGRWVPTRGTPTVEDVPCAPKGESRGAQPLWQEVWRMCLHKPTFFLILPPSFQEGGQGDGRTDGRWVPTRGTPTVEDVPCAPKGESRGAQPLRQEVWRMCLHKPPFFLILPPSFQEGGQGDGALPIEPRPRIAGSQSVRPAYTHPPKPVQARSLASLTPRYIIA